MLTEAQAAYLETVKPLSEWKVAIGQDIDDSDIEYIDEEFYQHDMKFDFEKFYYAGKDTSIKIETDDIRIKRLHYLKKILFENIVNTHYHGIINRCIKDVQIQSITFHEGEEYLLHLIDLYTSIDRENLK